MLSGWSDERRREHEQLQCLPIAVKRDFLSYRAWLNSWPLTREHDPDWQAIDWSADRPDIAPPERYLMEAQLREIQNLPEAQVIL